MIPPLSKSKITWLKNRTHDHRPKVKSLACMVMRSDSPPQVRNQKKQEPSIQTPKLSINGKVCVPYGNPVYVNESCQAGRTPPAIVRTQQNGASQVMESPPKTLAKHLKWTIHTLEIFWEAIRKKEKNARLKSFTSLKKKRYASPGTAGIAAVPEEAFCFQKPLLAMVVCASCVRHFSLVLVIAFARLCTNKKTLRTNVKVTADSNTAKTGTVSVSQTYSNLSDNPRLCRLLNINGFCIWNYDKNRNQHLHLATLFSDRSDWLLFLE